MPEYLLLAKLTLFWPHEFDWLGAEAHDEVIGGEFA
jgi:hypothetical protein